MTQTFPISVVVSTMQGRLLGCSEQEYRQFLDYMCGTPIPLWGLSDARKAVASHLSRNVKGIRSIPDMPEKTDSGNGTKHVRDCAKVLDMKEITLQPLRGGYTPVSLTELLEGLSA